jgi:hypothetical protein
LLAGEVDCLGLRSSPARHQRNACREWLHVPS